MVRTILAGGLSEALRRVIEGLLACNPDLAATIMRALNQRADPAAYRVRGIRAMLATELSASVAL